MEFETINLTTIALAALGVIGTAITAYYAALPLVKKHAVDQLQEAFSKELKTLRELVDAHEKRIVQQKLRIDEQVQINELQAEALQRDRREIEALQRKLMRYAEALKAAIRALQVLDPQHAHALQEEYADIMREEE